MRIVKSKGVTPTEQMLADLCERSFLKLWSYPNPHRDDGKELCDLLAVFENRVFIFFDRESRQLHKADKDPMINWQRWKREAVDAQVRTAHGAERYLRSGRRIFLDKNLSVPFPISVDANRMIVHKIVVAHGAKEACEKSSDANVYGSLAIWYGEPHDPHPFPFMIHIDKSNPVHVLDSHTVPIVFDELDTIYDFSEYLDEKLSAVRRHDLSYCGEEDLLAHYFLNFDGATNRHVIGARTGKYDGLMIGEGEWKDFVDLAPYKRKKAADQISYFWDELIQRTCQNALDGTLLGEANLLKGRSAIHEMAKEPRFSRRALSEHMIEAIRNFPDMAAPILRNLSFMPSFFKNKGYVFLQLKVEKPGDYEAEYRPRRQALLKIACAAAKNKFPQLEIVVGIAIDAPKFSDTNSEDFILMDCGDWPEERRAHYEKANAGLDFFKTDKLIERRKSVSEFPT